MPQILFKKPKIFVKIRKDWALGLYQILVRNKETGYRYCVELEHILGEGTSSCSTGGIPPKCQGPGTVKRGLPNWGL